MSVDILLIEPDNLSANLYKSALETAGNYVRIAPSAQDALNELDDKLPDVILLELDIPGHNGLEFLYEFNTYDDWLQVPVIVHSSIPRQQYAQMLVDWSELNVRDYLYKPDISLHELQRSVQLTVMS